MHDEVGVEGEISSQMEVPNEADEASSSSVGSTPANNAVQILKGSAYVLGNAGMMQMVDRELEDLLYADDAWMLTR